ncbi:MAG TPA: hypothetical protein VF898_04870 [Chloroflexota bacterium]
MRYLILCSAFMLFVLAPRSAISEAGEEPSVTLSPPAGSPTSEHTVQARGLPANIPATTALFAPDGQQAVNHVIIDSRGSVADTLQPPQTGWQIGLYRWVIGLADGRSYSATFGVSDGSPHLLAEPNLPSPTSAFDFVGVGFPPNQTIGLTLMLTGAGGERALWAPTDAGGSFSVYAWPQQFGFPFFSAGYYKILAPAQNLSTDFAVREHPVSSALTASSPVLFGGLLPLQFRNYPAQRYIWGLYENSANQPEGEFLVGPTSPAGALDMPLILQRLQSGTYYIATPYDYGEATFQAPQQPTPVPSPAPGARVVPLGSWTGRELKAMACRNRTIEAVSHARNC